MERFTANFKSEPALGGTISHATLHENLRKHSWISLSHSPTPGFSRTLPHEPGLSPFTANLKVSFASGLALAAKTFASSSKYVLGARKRQPGKHL